MRTGHNSQGKLVVYSGKRDVTYGYQIRLKSTGKLLADGYSKTEGHAYEAAKYRLRGLIIPGQWNYPTIDLPPNHECMGRLRTARMRNELRRHGYTQRSLTTPKAIYEAAQDLNAESRHKALQLVEVDVFPLTKVEARVA